MPRSQSQDRKPRRKGRHTHIYPVWNKAARCWMWRPAIKVQGKLFWGAEYGSQSEAHDVAREMLENSQLIRRVRNIRLGDAYKMTIDALMARGGSELTVKGYRTKFKSYSRIIDPKTPIVAIRPVVLRHFMLERRKAWRDSCGRFRKGVSLNTIAGDLTILHRVFEVAGMKGTHNPVKSVERPKLDEPDRPYFTVEQVSDIASDIRASGKPEADFHADLVLFLAMTGIRAHELERLRSTDVEWMAEGGGALKVRGMKGRTRKVRRVVFPRTFSDVVRAVLSRAVGKSAMSAYGLSTMMHRWRHRLALPALTARMLRRTYATGLDETGMSLRQVQDQMGHSQLTTTQKYLGARLSVALEGAEKMHARLKRDE